MTNPSIRWALAVGGAIVAQVAMIAISILCVAIYSYTIHTGETQAFYEAFAQASGPWISLIAGGPVFFWVARWIRRRAPSAALKTAMAQAAFYFAIEATVILLWPENLAEILPLAIGGSLLKLVGSWLGAGGVAMRRLAKAA